MIHDIIKGPKKVILIKFQQRPFFLRAIFLSTILPTYIFWNDYFYCIALHWLTIRGIVYTPQASSGIFEIAFNPK